MLTRNGHRFVSTLFMAITIMIGLAMHASPALAVSSCGADWCRIDNGASNFPINVGAAAAANECRTVTNTTGSNLFVPARTLTEWNAFKAKVLTGLTISPCDCTLPWGGSLALNASVTAYQNPTVACASSCVSETRTCTAGVLSGSYTNQSCSVGSCNCNLPWGGSIVTTASVTAYLSSAPACNTACSSQTRTCTNTVLSGTYTNQSCSSTCCLPWGGTIASGSSTTAYLTASVSACSSCTSQTRTCTNASLSGTYTNSSCTPNAASCGDGCCNGSETCSTCPSECGACIYCGDGICNGADTQCNCAADCGAPACGQCSTSCGDGCCTGGETCGSCAADCGACVYCGDGICNGADTQCNCAADCGAPACGQCSTSCGDGCCTGAETCSNCAPDCGACMYCGDSSCNNGETCSSCPGDCGACGPSCGDSSCNGAETCSSCPGDCGACAPYCGDSICNNGETVCTCGDCGSPTCGAGPPCGLYADSCGNMNCGDPCVAFCGDSNCDPGETCGNCAGDCGACDPCAGNTNCGECGNPACCDAACQCAGSCFSDCGCYLNNGNPTCCPCDTACSACGCDDS